MESNYLGRLIRDSRKMAGMTQEALAKAADVSTMSIRRYENGERKPTAEIMLRIMDAIGEPYKVISNNMLDEVAEEKKNSPLSALIENDRRRRELLKIAELKEDIGEEAINAFVDSENGLSMILFYLDLNDKGQNEAVKRIWELSEVPYYQRTPPPVLAERPETQGGYQIPPKQKEPSEGPCSPPDGIGEKGLTKQ